VSYYEALSAFAPSGAPLLPSGMTGCGLHESYGLTMDGSGDEWTANDVTPGINYNLGSISEFTSSGQPKIGLAGLLTRAVSITLSRWLHTWAVRFEWRIMVIPRRPI
jgi:hypothetical protein